MSGLVPLFTLIAVYACGTDAGNLPSAPTEGDLLLGYEAKVERAMGKFSAWSTPVNAGPGVNSAFQDRSPALSRDKLSLYFRSTVRAASAASTCTSPAGTLPRVPLRSGGQSRAEHQHRSQRRHPQPLKDGKLLLFARLMPDGFEDILVSEREDKDDDLGWDLPKGLCSELNDQAAHFNSPCSWTSLRRAG
jgi:hypothetical protein